MWCLLRCLRVYFCILKHRIVEHYMETVSISVCIKELRQSLFLKFFVFLQCRVPSREDLLAKVCEPSDWRWYCTIRPVPHKAHTYILCMEHMAGLVPILIGKQTNRIIPQFHISLYTSTTNPTVISRVESGSSAQVGKFLLLLSVRATKSPGDMRCLSCL